MFQKAVNYIAKGHVLHNERPRFTTRKMTFRITHFRQNKNRKRTTDRQHMAARHQNSRKAPCEQRRNKPQETKKDILKRMS
ncbi:unknown [Prevotella sp. CAG:1124]|nr:unknown [Prevotella sp. CAG:1124]